MQILAIAMMIVGALGTLGAGGWFAYLCAKHGYAWVKARIEARMLASEAALKAKAQEATGDIAEHVNAIGKEVVDGITPRLAALEAKLPADVGSLVNEALTQPLADIAALKARLDKAGVAA